MIRDIERLERDLFDVVVVGGGIFGCCIAWDAALRGLNVALLEQEDFAHATSANSFKMVHGGIRYIQHGDIPRIRESARERRALLKIAPHLVEPLPIVIPTYGHGLKGKELLAAGIWLFDLLTLDRNRGIRDPDRRIPAGRTLSRERVLEMFPGLRREGLTGAAVFHDAQMYNPTRLALAFLKGAAEQGALLANYARVEGLVKDGSSVTGVRARDRLDNTLITVRGKVVVNAAGPWAPELIAEETAAPQTTFSRDACFVVPRRITDGHALAVLGETQDPDALLSRQARHLFLVPWRDVTLVGVWHVVHEGAADAFDVRREELEQFVDEINAAYPQADIDVDEVELANAGLVLFGDRQKSNEHLSYGKRSLIIDHAEKDDLEGLVSVIGVRYTTARGVAEKAVDRIESRLRGRRSASGTQATVLPGGDFGTIKDLMDRKIAQYRGALDPQVVTRLVRNYGSQIDEVLSADPTFAQLGESLHLEAEVLHAVRKEMSFTLSDVVFRRTDMATADAPPKDALRRAAGVMARELAWSSEREKREVDAVTDRFGLPARPLTSPLPMSIQSGGCS